MGVVYHANYLVWFDRARTELMRETGLTYKELEQRGVYLAVSEVRIRYRAPARYDDLFQVRCWVRELASRRVTFGYVVERAATSELLATGETSLVSLTHQHTVTRMPPPDARRFDYVGPLGLGAGAAVVVADSAIWADPEKNFRSLVPAVRMLWAGLGIVRPPAPNAAVFSRSGGGAGGAGGAGGGADSSVRIWRVVRGEGTLGYRAAVRDTRVLEAEWRRRGKVRARSRTEFDLHLMPARARIDFPEGAARFELTVVAVDTAAVLDPAIWRGRR